MGLILDSSITIAAERRGHTVHQLNRASYRRYGRPTSGSLCHRFGRTSPWHLSRANGRAACSPGVLPQRTAGGPDGLSVHQRSSNVGGTNRRGAAEPRRGDSAGRSAHRCDGLGPYLLGVDGESSPLSANPWIINSSDEAQLRHFAAARVRGCRTSTWRRDRRPLLRVGIAGELVFKWSAV
jgi:hypothetical protein